ncbi:sn-glycerol-3-phosphate ABC transporter ATP-binding protein UgpC [Myxococcota bacterium]|nr:sn-glycerol-3-phosphate ABC transporter ATP-binding protein UgpC [Myxococcota bacterium]
MARLALEGVWKRFGTVEVVKDFNLEIKDGGFVVLVGPSGCGKSTALRMVAGLEQPSAGKILIGDRDVTNLSPRDRDVAMVFQSYALYPHMSVFENMAFGLRLRKMPNDEIDRRVREAAATLSISEYLERKPKALSGGQRQRVAMGRAIVRQPSVFLFDEPLSNLDAKLRVQMRAEIAKLHQRLGVTTVYVTHDQVEAMTLAQVIVVMKDGVIQQYGAPLEVYRQPRNMFVAGFVGSPAMNFFPCEVGGDANGPRLLGKGIDLPVPKKLADHVGPKGRKVVAGMRPEHLRHATVPGMTIDGVVEVLEPLGAEVHALGNVHGTPFTASLDPDAKVSVGSKLALSVEPDHIHVFDEKTQMAIGPGAGA